MGCSLQALRIEWRARHGAGGPGYDRWVTGVWVALTVAGCATQAPLADGSEGAPLSQASPAGAGDPAVETAESLGMSSALELAAHPSEGGFPWAVSVRTPEAGVTLASSGASQVAVVLDALPSSNEGEPAMDVRLKLDGLRSWSLKELEARGFRADGIVLGALADELVGITPGPHRLWVYGTTRSGAVVREPTLAVTSVPFEVRGDAAPAPSPVEELSTEQAVIFAPEGTLNGNAAQAALLDFHLGQSPAAWVELTAPDGSVRGQRVAVGAYTLPGLQSGRYVVGLRREPQSELLARQVITVNTDLVPQTPAAR